MSVEYLDLADYIGIAAEATRLDEAIVVKIAISIAPLLPDPERIGMDGDTDSRQCGGSRARGGFRGVG